MQQIVKEFHTIGELGLEILRIRPRSSELSNPSILMLHEGLGSIAMWKDFPINLAQLTNREVIVYSRAGNGKSSTVSLPRTHDYLHLEALEVLPGLIESLHLQSPVLFGHSDGASIALIFAGGVDKELSALILMAPHLYVEQMAVERIAKVKSEWKTGHGDLRQRMAKYHHDVNSVFEGWSDIWLSEDFRNWNIEEYLSGIDIPILAIQGYGDEYSSMDQIEIVQKAIPEAELLKLRDCGHSPHRDQPQKLLNSVVRFLANIPGEQGTGRMPR